MCRIEVKKKKEYIAEGCGNKAVETDVTKSSRAGWRRGGGRSDGVRLATRRVKKMVRSQYEPGT